MRKADKILKSDCIFDSIHDEPFAGFIATKGNKILAVESDASHMGKWADEHTEYIDCQDKLIMAGFIDVHMHFFDGIFQNSKYMCRDLFEAKSARECRDIIKKFADEHKDYETITGIGWYIPLWEQKELPTRHMLDEVDDKRPIYLMCADGHSFWLNTKALKECGITADQEVLFGSIELDEKGQPNGVLHELDVCSICTVKAQKLPDFQKKKLILDFVSELSKHGITSTTDITVLPKPVPITDELQIIEELEKANQLHVRLNLYPSLGVTDDFEIVHAYREKFSNGKVKVAGLKAFVDGVHGNHTALLLAPYADKPDATGASFYPYELYEKQIAAANREGYGVKLHCTGEGAVRLALDAYEHSLNVNQTLKVRNSIEHVEAPGKEDLDRFQKLDVTASVQPCHLMFTGNTLQLRLGEERAKMQYALKTMKEHGVNVAFSTDYPVAPFEPMLNLYFAVTRADLDGKPVEKETCEKLTMAEALKAYTINGAYCLNEENRLGSLEAGKLADIIVFDRNLFDAQESELLEAKVELTMVDGTITYRA